jgi:hypothetical protein
MKIKILSIFIIFLLQFNSTFVYAQPDRDLRDLQEYAKKFDEEQRKKRIDELERKLDGSVGSVDLERAIKPFLWLVVVALILTVGWGYMDRRSSSKSADKALSKAIREGFYSSALQRIAPLSKDEVLEMTIDEIAEKISKPKFLIKETIKELGWSAKNFDGAKAKATTQRINSETEKLMKSGLSEEEARSLSKERISYDDKLEELMEEESKILKSDLPLYLTIYGEHPNDDLTWYSICLDEKGNSVRGYKLFSEGISEIGISSGFKLGRNIGFETLKNPADFGSNVTISLYRKKFPATAKYVGVFISTSSKFLEDSKYHRNIKLEYSVDGFFANYESFFWNIDYSEPSQIFLGLVDLTSNSNASFVPAHDLRLELSDNYIVSNEQDKLLLNSFRESAAKLINKIA